MKHRIRVIVLISFSIILFLTMLACEKKPVVKSDQSGTDVDKSEITQPEYESIIDQMPVRKQVVDSGLGDSSAFEDTLNLVTVVAAIGRTVREAQERGFKVDDFSDPSKWNSFMESRPKTGEAFILEEAFEVDSVVILDKQFYSAAEIFDEFKDKIEEIEDEGKWMFFLYYDPKNENVVDYVGSYAAMRVANPDIRSVNDLTAIPRMIYHEDDLYVLRFATRTPEMDRHRTQRQSKPVDN